MSIFMYDYYFLFYLIAGVDYNAEKWEARELKLI